MSIGMELWGKLAFVIVAESLGRIIDQILQNNHKQYVMFNFQKFFTPYTSFLPPFFDDCIIYTVLETLTSI